MIILLIFLCLIPLTGYADNTRGVYTLTTGWFDNTDEVYLTARNSATASFSTLDMLAQVYHSAPNYGVARGRVTINTATLPAAALIDSVKITLVADQDKNQSSIWIAEGNGTNFNSFVGWAASGIYSFTSLADTFMVGTYPTAGDSIKLKLNGTGNNAIKKAASTIIFLLSGLDVNQASPALGNFYGMDFKDDVGYLEVWYTVISNTRAILRQDGTTTPYRTEGEVTPLKRP